MVGNNETRTRRGGNDNTESTLPEDDAIVDDTVGGVKIGEEAFKMEEVAEEQKPAASTEEVVDDEPIATTTDYPVGEENAETKAPGAEGEGESPEARGEKRKAHGEEEGEESMPHDVAAAAVAKKKRLCRYPGCSKVIKSQGHCQRHGAKAKRCKVDDCEKQAQGTHDGMCKRHWKAANFPEEAIKKGSTPPEPEGESVYDSILPMSIAYRPVELKQTTLHDDGKNDMLDPPAAPPGFQTMPIVAHLKEGAITGKPAGWHRNAERRSRGMFPVKGLSVQLEPWERQLALVEILLLSGGTPFANFKELAFAWGREKGFHHVLANSVCERRGEVERKKRSDCGKAMTDDEKTAFKSKLQKTRDKNGTSKKARQESTGEEDVADPSDDAAMDTTEEDPSQKEVEAVDEFAKTMAEEDHEEKMPAVAEGATVDTEKIAAVFV